MAFIAGGGVAHADPPAAPTITEPSVEGQVVSPADVHMEAGGFSDADETQGCTDWEIWTVSPSEKVWETPCAGPPPLNVHIHLGDGTFVGSYSGRGIYDGLDNDTQYLLKVRFHNSSDQIGPYATRGFATSPAEPPGVASDKPWVVKQPGYVVEPVATGLQLPVDIAFVPNPGSGPDDPFLYVTELYGKIEVMTRGGAVSDYATGLLNFDPNGEFPGSGETGVTGIAVDPASGDVFASMVYEDSGSSEHYNEVERFHSTDGGLTGGTPTRILDLAPEATGPSHQISNLSIGPDGKLYVHVGDGFDSTRSQNLNSSGGKILRINLDGTVPADNPFYNASDGITITDRIYAYGFRNPFGGGWRASDGAHYEVENGPAQDRFARVDPGVNYGFDDTNTSMTINALYNWFPAHAPVNLAFVQPETFGGSGFPADQMDHVFITESGPTYAEGPQSLGKRIVELDPDESGVLGTTPARTLIEYNGVGRATAAGLAAGPDGLYFTDLYKDMDATSPIDAGAKLWRVRYVGAPVEGPPAEGVPATSSTFNLKAAIKRCKKKFDGTARKRCIRKAKKRAA
jgi:glucose/arabinose dehydrogenase